MQVEAKLKALGLALPEPFKVPVGLQFPFAWVRVRGHRAYISGHVPQNLDGSLAEPLGRVGAEVTAEQGYQAARLVALAHLGSLKRALGDLDRVTAWLRVFAMVNAAPGFNLWSPTATRILFCSCMGPKWGYTRAHRLECKSH